MIILRKNSLKVFFVLLFLFLLLLSFRTLFIVQESKAQEYYKACASRRGKLRDAKKEKKTITFHQERIGVVRQLWIEEASSPIRLQREFYIEADQAELNAMIKSKENSIVETFQFPKGWLQEELYWEIVSTKERVIPNVNEKGQIVGWAYIDGAKNSVDPTYQDEIVPRQRTRYFDAAKADWDVETHEMTAYVVRFCIAELYGHEPKREIDRSEIILDGLAETMRLSFSGDSREKMVETTGSQLHLQKTL
ncbi:MAG: hypothetical protein QRY74_01360 [Chlamydia sp.]